MKKTIWSLAALMMLMAAPFMTSCSNDLDEVAPVEEQSNVVTITLNVEQQPETRVGLDTDLKLTSWETGNKVMLYSCDMTDPFEESINGDGVEFECTNPTAGTFNGTLPTGKSLSDYNLVVYGGTAKITIFSGSKYLTVVANTNVSTQISDLIVLAGYFNGTSATMKIVNNVIKINNTSGSPVVVAGFNEYNKYCDPLCWANGSAFKGFAPTRGASLTDFENSVKYTIPTGVGYINMGIENAVKIGFRTNDAKMVIPQRNHGTDTVGKLFDAGEFDGTNRS